MHFPVILTHRAFFGGFSAGLAAGITAAVAAYSFTQHQEASPAAVETIGGEPASHQPRAGSGDAVLLRAANIDRLKSQYEELNELCRGGLGDDPLTNEACGARENVSAQLEKAGWCYGGSAADAAPDQAVPIDWYRCETLKRMLAGASS